MKKHEEEPATAATAAPPPSAVDNELLKSRLARLFSSDDIEKMGTLEEAHAAASSTALTDDHDLTDDGLAPPSKTATPAPAQQPVSTLTALPDDVVFYAYDEDGNMIQDVATAPAPAPAPVPLEIDYAAMAASIPYPLLSSLYVPKAPLDVVIEPVHYTPAHEASLAARADEWVDGYVVLTDPEIEKGSKGVAKEKLQRSFDRSDAVSVNLKEKGRALLNGTTQNPPRDPREGRRHCPPGWFSYKMLDMPYNEGSTTWPAPRYFIMSTASENRSSCISWTDAQWTEELAQYGPIVELEVTKNNIIFKVILFVLLGREERNNGGAAGTGLCPVLFAARGPLARLLLACVHIPAPVWQRHGATRPPKCVYFFVCSFIFIYFYLQRPSSTSPKSSLWTE